MSVRPSQISPIRSSGNYASLLAKVRKTLIEGQRRIEQERIHTYLETGQIINTHILKYERADYGAQVIKQLAKDLNVGHRTLERCVQFAKTLFLFFVWNDKKDRWAKHLPFKRKLD